MFVMEELNEGTELVKGQTILNKVLKRKEIKADKKRPNLFYLGKRCTNKRIYKYLNLESALLSLDNSNLRFVQPSEWDDKFECRFYNASYLKLGVRKELHPKLYACCFTVKEMNEAAWKVYSYGKKGLAHRCVKFEIDLERFRDALSEYAESNQFDVYESRMNYSLSDEEIKNLHTKTSPYYSELFENFDLSSYSTLLSIKRKAFSYEKELRYFLIPKGERWMDKEIFIELPLSHFITDVKIAEDATSTELKILKSYCEKLQINTDSIEKELLHDCPDCKIVIEGDNNPYINEIVELIRQNPGIQRKGIEKELGKSSGMTMMLLRKYEKEGWIKSIVSQPKGLKWYHMDYKSEHIE